MLTWSADRFVRGASGLARGFGVSPLMLVVMLAALVLIWNGVLSRLDGMLLLTGMAMLVLWTLHLARSAPPDDPLAEEFSEQRHSVLPVFSVPVDSTKR